MAFADWLLPLLLLTADDEHGREPFEWLPAAPAGRPSQTADIAAR
jgi:hypothetical protein